MFFRIFCTMLVLLMLSCSDNKKNTTSPHAGFVKIVGNVTSHDNGAEEGRKNRI